MSKRELTNDDWREILNRNERERRRVTYESNEASERLAALLGCEPGPLLEMVEAVEARGLLAMLESHPPPFPTQRAYLTWSKSQVATVAELWPQGVAAEDIAERIGKTPRQVERKANHLGIARTRKSASAH